MSALPLVTMHYFSALLRAHWLLSILLTQPGLGPEADTVSDTAVSHLSAASHRPPAWHYYDTVDCQHKAASELKPARCSTTGLQSVLLRSTVTCFHKMLFSINYHLAAAVKRVVTYHLDTVYTA